MAGARTWTKYLLVSLLFISIFLSAYIAKRHLNPSDIILTEGLWLLAGVAAVCVAASLCLWIVHFRGRQTQLVGFTNIFLPATVTLLLFGYSFVITIPALLDRSISIFTLEAIGRAGPAGISADELDAQFLARYIGGNLQIDKRMHEQIVLGHAILDGQRYRLTPKGQFVRHTNLTMEKLLNVSNQFDRLPGPR